MSLGPVIVVGAGNAGLTAALAAHEAGADVVVLEKAPHSERGGNSRFSGGLFRFAYDAVRDLELLVSQPTSPSIEADPYPTETLLADLIDTAGGRADHALASVLADASFPTTMWMKSLGVEWEFSELFRVRVGDAAHYPPGAVVQAAGAGLGLTDRLFAAVESRGIPVEYDAPMKHLVTHRGRVTGVVVECPTKDAEIRGRAVVLAAGGFEASPEMRRRHLGPEWEGVRVRGSRFDTGEVLRAALDAGAQPYGEWDGCHATPIDAEAPTVGDLRLTDKTNRLSYPFGITVNSKGMRFVDEGEAEASHTYAKMGRRILAQPEQLAFQIFDAKTVGMLEARYATGHPLAAESIEELATLAGLPVNSLLRTVADFNGSVNELPFNPAVLDGKSTQGITPPKSNWAQPIDRPPFVAYPVTCGITFTYGGVKIDTNARVLDQTDEPIAGLFATGELTGGFFFGNYPGGAGLMRGAVFGRIGGRGAAGTR